MSKSKESQKVSKEDLQGRGIILKTKNGEEKRFNMKNSWHYSEKFQFAEKEDVCVDTKKKIKKGDFVSVGHRQINIEDPIDVEGEDVVHWNVALEDITLGEALKKYLKSVKEAPGFDACSKEQKNLYLKESGQASKEELAAMEEQKKAFTGVNAVVCGGFDDKDSLAQTITDNGGKVLSNVTKACNVLILGRSWVTKTRSKVGKGSPKHKAALKQKALIVKKSWVQKSLEGFKKTGKTALEQDPPTEKEMEAESEDERKEQDARDAEAEERRKEKEAKKKEEEKEKKKEKKETGTKRKRTSTKEDKEDKEEKDEEEPAEKKPRKSIDVAKLDKMSRSELQALAKENKIPANKGSDEIIKALKKIASSSK